MPCATARPASRPAKRSIACVLKQEAVSEPSLGVGSPHRPPALNGSGRDGHRLWVRKVSSALSRPVWRRTCAKITIALLLNQGRVALRRGFHAVFYLRQALGGHPGSSVPPARSNSTFPCSTGCKLVWTLCRRASVCLSARVNASAYSSMLWSSTASQTAAESNVLDRTDPSCRIGGDIIVESWSAQSTANPRLALI
jgi:hypothetical protein